MSFGSRCASGRGVVAEADTTRVASTARRGRNEFMVAETGIVVKGTTDLKLKGGE